MGGCVISAAEKHGAEISQKFLNTKSIFVSLISCVKVGPGQRSGCVTFGTVTFHLTSGTWRGSLINMSLKSNKAFFVCNELCECAEAANPLEESA